MRKYEITFTIETDEENDFAVEEAVTKALDEAIPCAGDDVVIRIQDHGSEVRFHDLYNIRVRGGENADEAACQAEMDRIVAKRMSM